MNDWNHYYYQVFPRELREFSAQHASKHHCVHCGAPQHRICLINNGSAFSQSAMFRFAWYGLTLVDQGLFTYFPEASERWVKATGGYPLPVEGGFCNRVVAPRHLLSREDSLTDWKVYVEFWLEEAEKHLESMSGISPQAFFAQVTMDRAFGEDPLEAYLMQAAMGRFDTRKGQD